MADPKDRRSARQEFQSRVRIAIAGKEDIETRFAQNMSDGGLFIRHDTPPPIGSTVLIEFTLPDGSCLSRVLAKVVHARPATTPGEKTAGMGLQFSEFDETAKALVAKFSKASPAQPPPVPIESIGAAPRPMAFGGDGPIVGIDLGTVNSCVAFVKNGKPTVLSSAEGYQIIPSVVFVSPEDKVLVGHRAVERMILNPGRAVYGSKRFLGRPFGSKEVRTLGHFFAYEMVATESGGVAAKIGNRTLPLEEVSSHILRSLKEMTERELGTTVQRAIITVPAYFGETQRQAVREAGRLAGFFVERLLNEPTAAAVAYGWGREALGTILVYDLGGGTFDVSILRLDGERVQVLASDGDPFLGGSDFDDRLTEYVLAHFERTRGINLRQDLVAVQRVRFACELAKRQLSELPSTELQLPYIARAKSGTIDLSLKIERSTLEALTLDLVDRSFSIVQQVLDRAKLTTNQLDDILLVGGQTRMPLVRRRLTERFARKPSAAIHPDEAVAIGAAVIAHRTQAKKTLELTDLLPASLRLAEADGSTKVLLPRGSKLPSSADIEVSPDAAAMEYRITIVRGEAEKASENMLVGNVRMAANHAMVLAQTKAKAKAIVNAEGILSIEMQHPMTGRRQEVKLSMVAR